MARRMSRRLKKWKQKKKINDSEMCHKGKRSRKVWIGRRVIIDEKKKEDEDEIESSLDVLIDECLGLVLSYLPFKQKFLLERVSKRWQRLMFIEEKTLVIGTRDSRLDERSNNEMSKLFMVQDKDGILSVNHQVLKWILKKCLHIEKIELTGHCPWSEEHDFKLDYKTLRLLANAELDTLKSMMIGNVRIRLSDSLVMFLDKHGSKLTKLEFGDQRDNKLMSFLLEKCPNLSEIEDTLDQVISKADPLPHLKTFKCLIPNDDSTLSLFCEKYAAQLVNLEIFDARSEPESSSLIEHLTKLKQLKQLDIFISPFMSGSNEWTMNDIKKFENQVKISLTLKLLFSCNMIELSQVYLSPFILANNNNLESLHLKLDQCPPGSINGSMKDLNNCLNVKQLIMDVATLPHAFFHDIAIAFPNLTTLSIWSTHSNTHSNSSNYQLKDEDFISFAKLQQLHSLFIIARSNGSYFPMNGVSLFIVNCVSPNLKLVHLNLGDAYVNQHDYCKQLILMAKSVPHVRFYVRDKNYSD